MFSVWFEKVPFPRAGTESPSPLRGGVGVGVFREALARATGAKRLTDIAPFTSLLAVNTPPGECSQTSQGRTLSHPKHVRDAPGRVQREQGSRGRSHPEG